MYSVYIHVPFCMKRCGYCDFNTYTAHDLGGGASRENYANLAVREMALVRQWQEYQGICEPPAATVFFGGGTPTILPANDLVRMLHAVRDIWGLEPDAEVTAEANPDTVDDRYIAELKDGGFTRISFGMQSAVPSALATLDRTHTPANVEAGVAAARRYGLRSSVDLIYGTSHESEDDWRMSIRTALSLGVTHVSAYALTVEPHTSMGRRIAGGKLAGPSDDDQAAKYRIADDMFSRAGLRWYEISNWAAAGDESQHNLGYWHNADWAGIGPGAHSHYNAARLRAWDIAHPKRWAEAMDAEAVPWQGSEKASDSEDLEERIMLGLRIRDGLKISEISRLAGRQPAEGCIDSLIGDGLITYDPSRSAVVPTVRGRLLNDLVIGKLFEAYGL